MTEPVRPTRRTVMAALASMLVGVGVLVPAQMAYSGTVVPGPRNLNVQILSWQNLPTQPYLFVRTALSGDLTRPDGSSGTFKVPLWLVYPQAASQCNGVGVVEPIHAVGRLPSFMNMLSYAPEGNRLRMAWPALADGASLFDPIHGGYTWSGVVWDKHLLQSLNGTTFQGIPVDGSYRISDPRLDRYLILAAASLVVRDPVAFVPDAPSGLALPCTAEHVVSGGYSNSALVLRSMNFLRLNTGLAGDSRFSHGLVFDGAIHGALTGNHCRDYAGELYLCDGPTPVDQGKVITLHPEYDVQQTSPISDDFDDGLVRGVGVRGEGPNWRFYEIAGVSHIASWSQDLKALRVKPASMPDQNYGDARPVFRAMLEHLRRWVTDGVEPPPNEVLEGQDHAVRFGGEDQPVMPWFTPSAFVGPTFDLGGDYDLNADGGIRLPHVRTQDFGAPLGLYRGPECSNPDPLTDPFVCPTWWNLRLPPAVVFGGAFYPYTAVAAELVELGLPNPCDEYGSHAQYGADVLAAAEYARDRRWILADDIGRIVSAAEKAAARYPGCVPARSHQ